MYQMLRSLQEEHMRAETREQECMTQILQSLVLNTQTAKQISTNYKQLCSNVSILMQNIQTQVLIKDLKFEFHLTVYGDQYIKLFEVGEDHLNFRDNSNISLDENEIIVFTADVQKKDKNTNMFKNATAQNWRDRKLMITNFRLCYLDDEEIKWSTSLKDIEKLILSDADKTIVLIRYSNDQDQIFYSIEHIESIVEQLQKAFFQLNNRRLPVHRV